MEYDRALFRVYERIMEDFNSSPSPMATFLSSEGNSIASTSRQRNWRSRRRGLNSSNNTQHGEQQEEGLNVAAVTIEQPIEHAVEGIQGDVPPTVDGSSLPTNSTGQHGQAIESNQTNIPNVQTHDIGAIEEDTDGIAPDYIGNRVQNHERRRRNRRRRSRHGLRLPRRRHRSTFFPNSVLASRQLYAAQTSPLPFFLPIWLSLKYDRMISYFQNKFGNRSRIRILSVDHARTGIFASFFRAALSPLGVGNQSPDQFHPSTSTPSRYRSLVSPHSPQSIRHHGSDDEESEVEMGDEESLLVPGISIQGSHSPSRSSSVDGLRRRNASHSNASSPSHNLSSQSNSPNSSSGSSPIFVPPIPSANYGSADATRATSSPVTFTTTFPISLPHSPAVQRHLVSAAALLQPRVSNSPSPSLVSSSSTDSSRQHSFALSSSSEGDSVFSNSRSSGDGEQAAYHSSTEASSIPTSSLVQRAIQMQMRQSERLQSYSSILGEGILRNRRHDEDDADGAASFSSESSNDQNTEEDGEVERERIGIFSSNNVEDESYHTGGCSQKNFYWVMRLSFGIGVFHLFVLLALHVTYVGPYAFQKQKFFALSPSNLWVKGVLSDLRKDNTSQMRFFRRLEDGSESESPYYSDKYVENCIAYALATRPPGARSNYYFMFGSGESTEVENRSLQQLNLLDDAIDDNWKTLNSVIHRNVDQNDDDPWQNQLLIDKRILPEASGRVPLLGKDEILQIKVLYGAKISAQRSRVHYVSYLESKNETADDINPPSRNYFRHRFIPAKPSKHSVSSGESNFISYVRSHHNKVTVQTPPNTNNRSGDDKVLNRGLSEDIIKSLETTQTDSLEIDDKEVEQTSPEFWDKPHYRFSIDEALLFLDEKSAYLHNITLVNVTLTERCLSTGSDFGRLTFLSAIGEFLSQIYGMDSIIINQLMYGIRGADGSFLGGNVQSMETKERWAWRKEQLESYEWNGSYITWMFKKIGILFMSLLAFFLVTSVTSLIVRVLTSSGVVLMFPLFSCFRALGVPGADERILALSYPWIGTARRAIRSNETHPQSHLVWAHVVKIFLYYVMYEASQAAWSVVLYSKSIPEALPVWIYGFAMIWEYFSMVFVRSALSVHFFPRATLLYFLLYHIYFYSVPYGYFDVALLPLFLFMVHAMIYSIFLDAPYAARGIVSLESPREVYNKLSWPEWDAQLPSEWTIFLPLNSRNTPLHDRQVSVEQSSVRGHDVNGNPSTTMSQV